MLCARLRRTVHAFGSGERLRAMATGQDQCPDVRSKLPPMASSSPTSTTMMAAHLDLSRRRSSSSPESYTSDPYRAGLALREHPDEYTFISDTSPVDQANVVHSTSAELQLERRYKNKPQKDKICLVCGDKALGYNFNAVSCESCKAFFRRNAFKEIRGRCEGKCEVTVESRSYCKKCRLRKCLEVGMKKELILNDQQKQVRRIKIQENRYRRQGLPVPVELQAQATACATASLPVPGYSPSPTTSLPSKVVVTSAGSPPQPKEPDIKQQPEPLSHTFTKEIELDRMEGLDDWAKEKIAEILRAFQVSFDGPMERNPVQEPSRTDFLNMADTSVKRLVKMAKHLSSFRSFSQEDQISLLKGAVVEVLVLRSAKMFDTDSKAWFVNKSGKNHMVAATSLLSNKESVSFFQQYQKFATSLLQSAHHDNVVLMLMIVMTVMSPDRSSIRSTKEIAGVQEEYASLLKHYIRIRYPEDELMFARVLQKLADVRDLNETHTRMLMHMRVEDLEPLIVEIFDFSS
ncbi:hypothetical protein LSH36_287g03022 [Paralvinella palmiformis]|uniref:Uncharacterized protein n=1 Tax=Paralvinella palmiformis TaxID=53620 RepID=A0AAD9JJS1_9ANNE|nr:hypothetical protein LSH36_287g03022 [Paralvinella palmiformis]